MTRKVEQLYLEELESFRTELEYTKSLKEYNLRNCKFIDLFAGIGGFRIPFERTFKSKCVLSCEIDEYAKKTYRANFQGEIISDIEILLSKSFKLPNFDILLAGFPCQPFSQGGKRKSFSDPRGNHFFNLCKILEKSKPKAFVFENVKGLLSINNGKDFQLIIKTLQDLNYFIHYKVLNAVNYNIPQSRERLFIVGLIQKKNLNFQNLLNKKLF